MATVSGNSRRRRRPAAKAERHAGGAPRLHESTPLGAFIERSAAAIGLHLDEVAKLAGLHYVTINSIRCGQTKNPSVGTLKKIAAAIRQPVEKLIALV